MEAILLVGGLGTRLGSLTKNTPKPMLPIRGVPFLERLLQTLKIKGITRVVLAIGYKKDVVESYFSCTNDSLPELEYSIESSPLGTGGAIRHALSHIKSDQVFVLNGDSYIDVNYTDTLDFHEFKNSDITIVSYYIKYAERYGVMQVNDDSQIISFNEKGACTNGLINGGVYLINSSVFREVFSKINEQKFSFEEIVLSDDSLKLKKFHLQTQGKFLDIGIRSDYEKAQKELFL